MIKSVLWWKLFESREMIESSLHWPLSIAAPHLWSTMKLHSYLWMDWDLYFLIICWEGPGVLVSRHEPSPAHLNNSDAVKKVLTALYHHQTATPLAASYMGHGHLGAGGSFPDYARVTLTAQWWPCVTSAAFSTAHYCLDMWDSAQTCGPIFFFTLTVINCECTREE